MIFGSHWLACTSSSTVWSVLGPTDVVDKLVLYVKSPSLPKRLVFSNEGFVKYARYFDYFQGLDFHYISATYLDADASILMVRVSNSSKGAWRINIFSQRAITYGLASTSQCIFRCGSTTPVHHTHTINVICETN